VFAGLYRFRIDAKGRVAVPARYREGLPSGSWISLGRAEGNVALTIYPPEQWREIASAFPKSQLLATSAQLALSRTLLAAAAPCEFDSQGRVTLSQEQRARAGIEPNSTVAIVGNLHVVEIWPEERWNEFFDRQVARFTENVDEVISQTGLSS
jgi:MraZ protein